MNPDRWESAKRLFHDALERPPADRDRFLREAAGGDDALREEVVALVAAQTRAGQLFSGIARASPPSVLPPGTRLGPYEIQRLIGAGGMGEVYQARDSRLGRTIAIKVLPEPFALDTDRRERFEREARAVATLNHPHICTLHDVGNQDRIDFLVMEYVEGRSLDQLIPAHGLPIRDAVDYATQVAAGLAAAHGAGIVHRDVKPANIMVTDTGQIKILDFGVAKLAERADGDATTIATASTTPGAVIGTAAYMSPEQANGESVDARADVFSFGAVLYEMLAGRRAFHGDSNLALLASILKESPEPLENIRKDVPADLSRIVSRCLEKRRDGRYLSTKALHDDLVSVREDLDRVERSLSRPSRRLRIAVPILAVFAVAAWVLLDREAPRETMLRPIPLTSFLGSQDWPSFSPDGEQVAFSWDGDKQDNSDIYVKRIGSGPPLRLTQNPAVDTRPAWAPDGNSIAFFRTSQVGRSNVVLVPPLGGPERVVTEVAQGVDQLPSLAWSPDSKWLVVFDRPVSKTAGLWLLSVETGERRQLTSVPLGLADFAPAISPGGGALAFARRVAPNSSDLYVLALGDDLLPRGEPRRLTQENQVMWGLAWTADGQGLVFSSGAPGNVNLWRMAISKDSRPTRLFDQGEVLNVAVAARSNRLVFVLSRREMDIYRAELSGGGTDAQGLMPLITSSRQERFPSYAPDGKKIAFVSVRSGNWQLWVSDSDGANPVQMTSFEDGEVAFPSWSLDGQQIGFIGHAEGVYQAYVIDAAGGKPRKLEALGTDVGGWKWSRDGRSVLFPSARTGTLQLWKMPASGGAAEQLTRQGAGRPTESPGGKLIYYPRLSGGVWSVPAEGGVEREIFKSNVYSGAIEATRSGIYFITDSSVAKDGDLMFYRFPNGPVTKIAGVQARYGISVSPDERWLAYTRMTSTGSDLMLVENFR